MQHSAKEQHKSVSKDRFSSNAKHIADGFIEAIAVSDELLATCQRIVLLDPALAEKVAAAKTKQMFKLAKSDISFSSCDHLSDAF